MAVVLNKRKNNGVKTDHNNVDIKRQSDLNKMIRSLKGLDSNGAEMVATTSDPNHYMVNGIEVIVETETICSKNIDSDPNKNRHHRKGKNTEPVKNSDISRASNAEFRSTTCASVTSVPEKEEKPKADKSNTEKVNKKNTINRNSAEVRNIREDVSAIINDSKKFESKSKSWIKFNQRVLGIASDINTPLFERLKFLGITESNLDEFSMVRMSKTLKNNIHEYKDLKSKTREFIKEQQSLNKELITCLEKENFQLVRNNKDLNKKEKAWLKRYFEDKMLTGLTPMVYDRMRPFRMMANKKLYIAVTIETEKGIELGTVEVPDLFGRLIEIKTDGTTRKFILAEDLMILFINNIFKNVRSYAKFRILKSSDYEIDKNDEIFVESMVKKLKVVDEGQVMRMDIQGGDSRLKETLSRMLNVTKTTAINNLSKNDIIDLTYLLEFMDVELTSEQEAIFKYAKFESEVKPNLKGVDLFQEMDDNGDIILQHPYESYDTVIDFINQAADSPDTVAIKQTLYRVSKNSPIVKALMRAARRGVMVTVICELKARFDEANNIRMAREMERAGCNVIYGIEEDLKIHAKMCLVVKRKPSGKLKHYCHLSTGNYNEKSAQIYTDISYFTCKKSICKDIITVFNNITARTNFPLKHLYCSPYNIADKLSKLIDREISNARQGKPAYIKFKCNGVTDPFIISKIYEAADAGVDCELVVRGMCSLIDTEKVKVKSILGRFLEHSRIYEFCNNGDSEIFISSADLMERNLYSRVELLVPMHGSAKKQVRRILEKYMLDESAFIMDNGIYKRMDKTEFKNSLSENDIEMNYVTKHNKKQLKKDKRNVRLYSSQELFLRDAKPK